MVTKVKGGVLDESALSGKNMTGDIAFDTSTLKIDSSNNRVGIGTASPSSLLHLGGTNNKGIQITSGTSNAGYLAVYQDQAIFSINRNGADGSFADTAKAAAVIKMHSADADSKIELQTTTSNNAEPTTRMTILKSGNVGIGDTSPTRELSLKKTTDHSIMAITTGTSTLAGIVMGDTGADDQGGVIYNNSGDYLYFRTGGAERLRILNGGGLTFNGDTAGANALDDYEEGTWTPGFGGATLTVANGVYTKIGNTVHVHYQITTSGSLPTSSAQAQINSLPFTSGSSHTGAAAIYARYYTPNDSTLTSIIADGDTVIRLINTNDQSFDYTTYGELEASHNNSVTIIGSATYQI